MEIFIGREPENSRLKVQSGGRVAFIGQVGSVPKTVSRNDHCKITVSSDGGMLLMNMREQNFTYVDGQEVETKKITSSSRVELGPERYTVDMNLLMKAISQLGGGVAAPVNPEKPTYSIKGLKRIYEKYEADILQMQVDQAKVANRQKLQGILSLSATLVAVIPELGAVRFIILGVAVLFAIYSFYQSSQSDNLMAVKKQKRDHQFQREYVCPNPECGSFKGNMPYVQLKNYKTCPTCGCKYTEQ